MLNSLYMVHDNKCVFLVSVTRWSAFDNYLRPIEGVDANGHIHSMIPGNFSVFEEEDLEVLADESNVA